MPKFIDFKALKALCSLEQVAYWLGLELKNDRCQCPVNMGDKRELVLTFDKGIWFCFGCKKKYPNRKNGGDSIALVQHVLDYPEDNDGYIKAAEHMQTKFHGYTPDKRGLPENGFEDMEYKHERIQALGLSPEKAEELGIGYRNRGTTKKAVLFPLRDKSGKLLGYVIHTEDGAIKLPKALQS